jgi:hypothetical protein
MIMLFSIFLRVTLVSRETQNTPIFSTPRLGTTKSDKKNLTHLLVDITLNHHVEVDQVVESPHF